MVIARLCLLALLASTSRASWLYLNSFQTGVVTVWDSGRGAVARTIEVEDKAGAIGLAITSDGARVFIADGGREGRLRVVDALTGREVSQVPLHDRRLSPGNEETIWLTGDDRWLLVRTYDYGAAADGVRIYDVKNGAFRPLGLRYRPCAGPEFAAGRGSLLFVLCPGIVGEMEESPRQSGDFAVRATAPIKLQQGRAAAGDSVALVAGCPDSGPCMASVWSASESKVRDIPLTSAPTGGRSLDVSMSRDGRRGAVVAGSSVLLIDVATATVKRRIELPGDSEGAAFSQEGGTFWTLARGQPVLYELDSSSGSIRTVKLVGATPPRGPSKLKTSPALPGLRPPY